MKPEYQFKVDGLVNKEKVLSGLMESGYIVSCKTRVGNTWEISVYGKERVDGGGHKPTDWYEKMDVPSLPQSPIPNTTLTPWITTTSTGTYNPKGGITYTVNNTSDMVLREPAGFGTREVME